MRYRSIVFVLACVVAIAGISYLSGRLGAPTKPDRSAAGLSIAEVVREIDAGRMTSPIVGEQPRRGLPTLTFVAKASGAVAPRIVSDVTSWGERPDGHYDATVGAMTKVAGTDWYALELKVEPYARIEYLIVYGPGDFRQDPHNARVVQRANGPASEVVMPGYQAPQEFIDPPVSPSGSVTEAVVPSRAIGAPRRVILYLPPGYDAAKTYPMAVFHDGDLVVNQGQAPRVLDWLIAHQAIEPIVAAFVDPVSRTDDYKRGAPMRAFVSTELLEYLATKAHISTSAADRAIIGISAGARGALDAASATKAYGKLGLMLPALDAPDIQAIAPGTDHAIRTSILAAHYDPLNLPSARGAQLMLADQGHRVTFKEVPEGHSTATWRTHLRDVLIDLFGTQMKR